MRPHREHPELELLLTENGAAYPHETQPDGSVADADRISYLEQHLAAVHRSIADGANVRGYYLAVWHRSRRLRHPGTDAQGQRPLVCRRHHGERSQRR